MDTAPLLLTGANGFTGRFVAQELQRRGLVWIALLRPGRDASWFTQQGIAVRFADLNDVDQLSRALAGCRALLNVASIGFGAAPALVEACRRAGVRRAVFVGTTAVFTQLNAASKAVRLAAEATIAASDLDWTLLRPTMIYGTPDDRNMIRLVRWLDRCPLLPVFGPGRALQQPVHVADVAWAIAAVVDAPQTYRCSLDLSGAEPLSYRQVLELTAAALQRRVWRLHLPAAACVWILQRLERLGLRLPLKAEQIQRLNEDKVFPHDAARQLIGFTPMGFAQGIASEVALYRQRQRAQP